MAGVKHAFSSAVPNTTNAAKVGSSKWNEEHLFDSGNVGALAVRGSDNTIDAISSVAAGQVLASVSAGAAPAYSAVPLLSGIAFPATQVSSGNANTLDDYEEGTFTPTLVSSGGGAPTYATQGGAYIKQGRTVTIWIALTITAKNTLGAGLLTIAGLPFTHDGAGGEHGGSVGYHSGFASNIYWPGAHMSSVGIYLGGHKTATTIFEYWYVADISNAFRIHLECTYRTAN